MDNVEFNTKMTPNGSAGGNLPDLDLMLPIYYDLRGWDETGAPTPERLRALDLI